MGCINSSPDIIVSSAKITNKNKIPANKYFSFADKEEDDSYDDTFHSSIEKSQITFRAKIGDKKFIIL